MTRAAVAVVVALATWAGCSQPSRQGYFRDQPVAWRVDDTRSIDEPKAREFFGRTYIANALLFRRATRWVDPPGRKPALNTNALDDVPDSTWFTNRLGMRRLTPEEVAIGNDGRGPPQPPLRVVGHRKGEDPSFIVRDARGVQYLIKIDVPEHPEQQTGAAVIVNRLLWAAGYHVPPARILYLRPEELTRGDLAARVLDKAVRRPDGARRVLAIEILAGVPKGGFAPEGTRADDPNDRVPHQHRRELRGLRVFASWLGHTNMREDNTLDLYVHEGGRRFLRHYLIDFGEALGGHRAETGRMEVGWEYAFDWKGQGKALISFGLLERPWEEQKPTRWKAVGVFSAEHFNPSRWREYYPYWPFFHMGAPDAYWAAKILMRFDRPLIAAAVEQAHLSEPGAAEYLIETLLERRDIAGRTYLRGLTPLDEWHFEGRSLCAIDLAVHHGFAHEDRLELIDDRGRVQQKHGIGPSGRVCFPLRGDGDYVLQRLRVRRAGKALPAMQVHYKAGPRPRILGVVRVEWWK